MSTPILLPAAGKGNDGLAAICTGHSDLTPRRDLISQHYPRPLETELHLVVQGIHGNASSFLGKSVYFNSPVTPGKKSTYGKHFWLAVTGE